MSNSGNILKSNFIKFTGENTRVIDSSALVAKRLEGLGVLVEAQAKPEGFVAGLNAEEIVADPTLDMLTGEGEFEEQMAVMDEPSPDAMAQSEMILENANLEAKDIIDKANAEAEIIKQKAYEEGYQAGSAEADNIYAAKLNELMEKEAKMDSDFQKLVLEIEPKMVEVISDVYRHIFSEGLFDKKQVMCALISKALLHIEQSSEISILVSPLDYKMIDSLRETLMENASLKTMPEIVLREDFEEGAAKIETPFGIIDCGIDTELNELTKTLIALSFEGN